ncbi:aminoglycoside phosphotransferase family protein [Streptomyces sp. CB01881]|uniref:phosphotransferase family protein n=1 Tax=Streptomyces sp. CB01881 TaxID=2078691 RepID=UPI000CDBFD20|nr:aminoglycoside phosphotransferase family protein [Streptomyces sp. CB01881]AUY53001.1 aminoglycoside phosphotransferase [Streptomyces sp. CB01881]TYC70716.1 aminoglycoside phosphotransferase family protein [Streptomyces sp. CB01881]
MSELVAHDDAQRNRDRDRDRTWAWVEGRLADGSRVTGGSRLRGGFTSEMRRLRVEGPEGAEELVLRSFVAPFYLRHAEGLLTREADILTLLGADGGGVPVATLRGVDATGEFCAYPSLLMTLLPGTVRVDEEELDQRCRLLAGQLARIHRVDVPEHARPRDYQAWVTPEGVRRPAGSARPEVWERAVEVIRRPPPSFPGRFLHRDYHPGNVLFSGGGSTGELRITGVVDWVETSWGPADLDVAHCSTALALLYGVPAGMAFAGRYLEAGGDLAVEPADHLYWRLLDALAFAPDAEKVGVSWRELGRTDLTPALLAGRLEEYVEELLKRFG